MKDRERLLKLILQYSGTDGYKKAADSGLVDYLLKHGVCVKPCKVWDKTYLVLKRANNTGYDIYESKCVRITDNGYGVYYSMAFDCPEIGNTLEFGICDFGKCVFFTRRETEKRLKLEIIHSNGLRLAKARYRTTVCERIKAR